MKSFSTLSNLFNSLSQNTTSTNTSLGKQLINDGHRYLIQKYFDNERSYTTLTIGAQSLTLTGSLSSGATTATLNTAWTGVTTQQLVVFSNSQQRTVTFSQNSTSIFWLTALTATATTAISTIGVQAYPIPANVSKIKNDTITVGQLVYTPAPVQSIQEWTMLNALPYTSDIPNYFFIYQNQVMFWPIPSTAGNIITFNYKSRVADMTYADYTTGTIASTVGSTSITGTGTTWNSVGTYPLNTDLSFVNLMIAGTPPKGDGLWYPIQNFTSDSALATLLPVVNAPTSSGQSYTIGQFPILQEDFHDMIVYGALMTYFSSIVDNESKFKRFETLYEERIPLLEQYAGTKSVNVDLGAQPVQSNPNLFIFAQS